MKLKKNVEIWLSYFSAFLFAFLIMVDSVSLSFIPILFLLWGLLLVCVYLLKKYGRGVLLDEEI